jgi:hypothetical protein
MTGVTVMPEFIQNEGIERVLANLARAGITSVTTSPYVMEPADEKTGSREPPIDAGAGSVRLLDRPLWGKRELFVRTAPSFTPDVRLYEGLRYQPPPAAELTRASGGILRDFVRAARSRGMKVYLQVQAAIPPGYRVQFGGPQPEDKPRLPEGGVPPRTLANNGSLASPHIVQYAQALARDLIQAYPALTGLRFDWPEYPPYFLDDVFLDFGPHARTAAARLGFAFEHMRTAAGGLYRLLHGGLTDAMLERWLGADGGRYTLLRLLADDPALLEWLRFKAVLAAELAAGLRRAMDEAGASRMELLLNAFPPPFSLASGMDYGRIAPHCSAFLVKLYTMHWPVILRFYGEALAKANPQVTERLLVDVLKGWLDITDPADKRRQLAEFRYPEPEEPHPTVESAQARKILDARAAAGRTPVFALVHGYGPPEDFRRRLVIGRSASPGGVWINRYGYLSDRKLDIIGGR